MWVLNVLYVIVIVLFAIVLVHSAVLWVVHTFYPPLRSKAPSTSDLSKMNVVEVLRPNYGDTQTAPVPRDADAHDRKPGSEAVSNRTPAERLPTILEQPGDESAEARDETAKHGLGDSPEHGVPSHSPADLS